MLIPILLPPLSTVITTLAVVEQVRARERLTHLGPLVHSISDAGADWRAVLLWSGLGKGRSRVDRIVFVARLLAVLLVGLEDEIARPLASVVSRIAVALGRSAHFFLLFALENLEGRIVEYANE